MNETRIKLILAAGCTPEYFEETFAILSFK